MRYLKIIWNIQWGVLLLVCYTATAGDNGQSAPLAFVQNVGQVTDQYGQARNDIGYKLSANGLNMFIGAGAIYYQWNKVIADETAPAFGEPDMIPGMPGSAKNIRTEYCRLEMELIGANKSVQAVHSGAQVYYEKYFTKSHPEGVTANTYNTITYKNIYPGIDWVIYTSPALNGSSATGKTVKYDFIVHPAGDVKNIRIVYKGAEDIHMKNGNLTVTTAFGSITEPAPYTYDAATKQSVASKFVLEGNQLSFETAPHRGTLVIDPILEWATYYGGSDYEFGQGTATDQAGNVYLGGWTASSNNIATTGAYLGTLPTAIHSTYFNGFLVKFNINGQRQWGTYFPANVSDVACDNSGNIYITGGIDSIPGFATTGAHQVNYAGKNTSTAAYNHADAYLAKFNSNGQRQWATYYGGSDNDHGCSVACDPSGNVYLSGATHSANNISTTGAFKTVLPTSNLPTLNYSWGKAGFLAKFNSGGVRQWGTYFAGTVVDIEVDGSSNLYIAGVTWHDTGVATTGAFKTTHSYSSGNNLYDGYLAKFTSGGSRLWSTYFGSSGYDLIYAVELDNAGNAYISGQTNSTTGISSTGSSQATFGGVYDAMLAKFSSSGARIWSTYIGGTGTEYAIGLAITPQNRVFATGPTSSTNAIATTGALRASLAGNTDDFIFEFDTAGTQLYGTYYGGTGYEYGWGVNGGGYFVQGGDPLSYSLTGRLYHGSSTSSSSGISTSGVHQSTHGGGTNNYDAYLAAFIVDTLVYIIPPAPDTSLCPGDTFKIVYATTYPFKSGNTFTVQLSDGTGSFASPVTVGTKNATTGDTITCVAPINATLGTGYRVRIISSNPARISAPNPDDIKIYTPPVLNATNNTPVCAGDTIQLNVTASHTTGVSFSWTGTGTYTGSGQTPQRLNAVMSDTGNYIVTADIAGCKSKDTTHVSLYPIPAVPTASSNSPVCPGSTINLTASSTTIGVTYTWSGPGSFSSTTQNPSISNAAATHAGTYFVTATQNGCTSAAGNTNVQVYVTTAIPVATSNSPICTGQDLTLFATTVTGATYSWQGPGGFSLTSQNPVRINVSKSMAGKYYVTATINGCISAADTVELVVNDGPQVGIYPSPDDSICAGGSIAFIALPSHTGTSTPAYAWLKNGMVIASANAITYLTGNITGGDMIQCVITATGTCSGPISDTSNVVILKNKPVFKPAVSISANPGTVLWPYTLVTFTAAYTGGGKTPVFQWMRNGTTVVGATNAVWGTTDISDGDSISVRLVSSDQCAQPKDAMSNKLGIKINLSVDKIYTAKWELYPNPNDGNFALKGYSDGEAITIQLCNSVGQIVYTDILQYNNGPFIYEPDYTGKLSSGIYFLHIQTREDMQVIKMVVE